MFDIASFEIDIFDWRIHTILSKFDLRSESMVASGSTCRSIRSLFFGETTTNIEHWTLILHDEI